VPFPIRCKIEIDEPPLSLFKRDARRLSIRHLDARARAFLNLFSALGDD
jgi:hypothetical protein